MNTFSWRKDLKLNATRCFTGTQATVSSTQETFVQSGSRVKRVLTWAKVEKDIVAFNAVTKTFLWRTVLKLTAARCFFGTHATVRFTKQTVVTIGSFEACFDQGDVKVENEL